MSIINRQTMNFFDALDNLEDLPELKLDAEVSAQEIDIMASVEDECRRKNFYFDYVTCLLTIKKLNGTKGTHGAIKENPGQGAGDQKTNPGSY